MIEIIRNLLKIKSIWSLVACGVFVYLAVSGKISGEVAMTTVTAIVTYYFVKKDDKDEQSGNSNKG